jgi:hypothetical protein
MMLQQSSRNFKDFRPVEFSEFTGVYRKVCFPVVSDASSPSLAPVSGAPSMVCDGKHLDRIIDAAIDDAERETF